MDVLILGFSSIIKRRVLPALISLKKVDRIHVASRQQISEAILPVEKQGDFFDGYEKALKECKPCLCYISLPNSLHAEWARRALQAGFHVVVDKPSVTNVSDAKGLVDLSNSQGLCLAEANVWHYHPLTEKIKELVEKETSPPLSISAIFSSPALDPGNFRYNPELGAGILFDRGSYVVSCGRIFFGKRPQKISCEIVSLDKKNNVDISLNFMMVYPGGAALQGFLSLEAEYQNKLSVIGASYSFQVERIFTPPADFKGEIEARRNNKIEIISVAPSDTFGLFINDVIGAIERGSFSHFSYELMEDAEILARLIASAK